MFDIDNINLDKLSYREKSELLRLINELERREETGGHLCKVWPDDGPLSWKNYPKHMKFLEATNRHREVFFSAANRAGKSIAGAYATACQLTGIFPDWYPGKKLKGPINAWAAGDTSQTTRDIVQKELLGPPGQEGTGMIARELILDVRKKPGVPGAVESVQVRHASGGTSYLGFKSYDQGRRSFQGTAMDWIWADEEIPADVYGECVMRLMTTKGTIIITATPIKGLTPFVQSFLDDAETEQADVLLNE